ncbi:Reverse transcriptase domain-containing protein [Vibrio chagasii]|nr:Reverse transcriptase domain-containing protein [Vibrio chagasii]CAH7331329.1 Reverse transcriptase domain-containing protein [Vibrio chagasii]
MLEKLLKKGYFPQEIPTTFSTINYGDVLIDPRNNLSSPFTYNRDGPVYSSECAKFNLARRGKLRRPLSIPNPINYYQLAKLISDHWADFDSVFDRASQSISRPVVDDSTRALKWEKGFSFLPDSKLKTRTASRYILKADISNFYSTIYTHSIPWVLHTKSLAKQQRRFRNNLGNKIDTLVRNSQDQQTKGIPIGTDTSFAIAELIMSEVDKQLVAKIGTNYHRYIDDFEFGCKTLQEAEHTLSVLQEVLSQFELELNSSKTEIIKLPLEVDPQWLHELQKFDISMATAGVQRRALLSFFDMTMDYLSKEPFEPILKYAVVRTSSHIVQSANYALYQRILLQWATAEPSTLPIVIDFIAFYKNAGIQVDIEEIKQTLEFVITENSRQSHTSEICWAIWGMMLLDIEFTSEVVDTIKSIENSFVALLTLDAQQRGLISDEETFELWESLMNPQELKGSNWLLAYEALKKGWLAPVGGQNYLDESIGFSFLSEKNVSFYDPEKLNNYDPQVRYYNFSRLNAEQLRYFLYRDRPINRPPF